MKSVVLLSALAVSCQSEALGQDPEVDVIPPVLDLRPSPRPALAPLAEPSRPPEDVPGWKATGRALLWAHVDGATAPKRPSRDQAWPRLRDLLDGVPMSPEASTRTGRWMRDLPRTERLMAEGFVHPATGRPWSRAGTTEVPPSGPEAAALREALRHHLERAVVWLGTEERRSDALRRADEAFAPAVETLDAEATLWHAAVRARLVFAADGRGTFDRAFETARRAFDLADLALQDDPDDAWMHAVRADAAQLLVMMDAMLWMRQLASAYAHEDDHVLDAARSHAGAPEDWRGRSSRANGDYAHAVAQHAFHRAELDRVASDAPQASHGWPTEGVLTVHSTYTQSVTRPQREITTLSSEDRWSFRAVGDDVAITQTPGPLTKRRTDGQGQPLPPEEHPEVTCLGEPTPVTWTLRRDGGWGGVDADDLTNHTAARLERCRRLAPTPALGRLLRHSFPVEDQVALTASLVQAEHQLLLGAWQGHDLDEGDTLRFGTQGMNPLAGERMAYDAVATVVGPADCPGSTCLRLDVVATPHPSPDLLAEAHWLPTHDLPAATPKPAVFAEERTEIVLETATRRPHTMTRTLTYAIADDRDGTGPAWARASNARSLTTFDWDQLGETEAPEVVDLGSVRVPTTALRRADGTVETVRGLIAQRTEVTQSAWRDLMGALPEDGHATGPDEPVDGVEIDEAMRFANAMSEREGLEPAYDIADRWTAHRVPTANGWRLPLEAEFQVLLRAGGARPWGLDDAETACRTANLFDVSAARSRDGDASSDCDDGFPTTAPVAQFAPNPLGLYDVVGNVAELVWVDEAPDHVRGGVAPKLEPMGLGWAHDWGAAPESTRRRGNVYVPRGVRLVRPDPDAAAEALVAAPPPAVDDSFGPGSDTPVPFALVALAPPRGLVVDDDPDGYHELLVEEMRRHGGDFVRVLPADMTRDGLAEGPWPCPEGPSEDVCMFRHMKRLGVHFLCTLTVEQEPGFTLTMVNNRCVRDDEAASSEQLSFPARDGVDTAYLVGRAHTMAQDVAEMAGGFQDSGFRSSLHTTIEREHQKGDVKTHRDDLAKLVRNARSHLVWTWNAARAERRLTAMEALPRPLGVDLPLVPHKNVVLWVDPSEGRPTSRALAIAQLLRDRRDVAVHVLIPEGADWPHGHIVEATAGPPPVTQVEIDGFELNPPYVLVTRGSTVVWVGGHHDVSAGVFDGL